MLSSIRITREELERNRIESQEPEPSGHCATLAARD
jgi:hypothetical protein